MKRADIFRMALSSLGANKLRSALTMLGITIGVFSVIGVMTAISALQGSIESGLSFLGSNIFQFSRTPVFRSNDNERYRNRPNINYAQGVQFARLMQGKTEIVCFKVFKRGVAGAYGGRKTNPNQDIVGTNEYFLEANSQNIGEGRMLNASDVDMARGVVVIGGDLRDKLFPNETALGKVLRVAGRNYQVVGIFETKGSGFGGSNDNQCAIPITRFFADFGGSERSLSISVQSSTQATYDATLGHAVGVMRKVRGLRVEDPDNFDIYSNDSLTAAFTQVAGTIRIGAFVISGIALIAAGVGIMNIMLVSVTERTKEIGVRKSLGARRGDILGQFLLESLFISELGGLAGIVLGVLGGNALAVFLKASVFFPWGWAIVGLVVCSAIGIGFGMYPAHKAAGLDPVEALRFE
ncbi:MAG TPA: ABC transporter permease [Chthoniobacterales bacterium]|jgi:putative ABC transport system permease protein